MLDQALQLNQNKLKPTTINYIYTNNYYSTSLSTTLQLKHTSSPKQIASPKHPTLRPCAPTRACVAAPWWVAQRAHSPRRRRRRIAVAEAPEPATAPWPGGWMG